METFWKIFIAGSVCLSVFNALALNALHARKTDMEGALHMHRKTLIALLKSDIKKWKENIND